VIRHRERSGNEKRSVINGAGGTTKLDGLHLGFNFLMLMALFSAVLGMQDYCIAGIDALFPWCAEKAKFRCTRTKCPKICIIFSFIQNSELTCFLAIF
jgi:hypothetical protein